MTRPNTPLFSFTTSRAAAWLVAAALLMTTSAHAQTGELLAGDPPSQVARLSLTEGAVSVAVASGQGAPGSAPLWQAAEPNRPLTSADQVWAGKGARAELHVGSTALRMSELTSLDLLQLDDSAVLLRLNDGSLRFRVRALYDGQRLEISTPNLVFTVAQPGDYRLDVNRAADTTRVVVQTGAGLIQGERPAASPLSISAQQQGSFSGTQLTVAAPGPAIQDPFDAWAMARDRLEDQSPTARYVPREVVGYQQLDSYGDWRQDIAYGAVWVPRNVSANWAPYREGQWRWVAPWGWTWVDDAPWGFAPFHYGRWAQIGPRWGWVPGRLAPRPVYAPALVGFIDSAPGQRGSPQAYPGNAGWFPLAPGEAFRPGYRSSPRYVTQINHNTVVNPLAGDLRYQRQDNAISRTSGDDFNRGWAQRPQPGPRPPQWQPMPAQPRPAVTPQIGQLPGGPVTGLQNGAAPPPSQVNRGNDRGFGGPDGRALGQVQQRGPDTLLEADIQARRDQFRLQREQYRQQDGLAQQQEAQRQRDEAPVGERAMRLQQEQADRIGRQMQDAQRHDFQRAQQQQLQQQRLQPQPLSQPQLQPQLELQRPEAVGQQAMREQAQRQQQSDERVRAQQADRSAREPGARRSMPGMVREP